MPEGARHCNELRAAGGEGAHWREGHAPGEGGAGVNTGAWSALPPAASWGLDGGSTGSCAESWFIGHPGRGVLVRESPALHISRKLA